MTKIDPKIFKVRKSDQKISKNVKVTAKILLMTKRTGLALKILLLVPKPNGHLVRRCRNNLQLWKEDLIDISCKVKLLD